MKYATITDILSEGRKLRQLCSQYNATMIVDDHVELVDMLHADGVHLGKNDMPVAEARALLGKRHIIGATANTFNDILLAWEAGADYIGLGPFRFTTTKTNLSTILGLEGYRTIIQQCHDAHIDLPIVAIGGITASDMTSLKQTGISGVAISGAILNAIEPAIETAKFIM